MTDEQIIKILEWHIAADCCVECEAFENGCNEIILTQKVLDLINRQKAEIERLKNKNTLLPKKKCKDINTARKIIKSEAIKEFADKINELLTRYSHLHDYADNARRDTIEAADGIYIEMQSVWDVFTLKNNEMSKYEEMNRLQKNIETIAEERLLKEIEKDFRLLVKEMTEGL